MFLVPCLQPFENTLYVRDPGSSDQPETPWQEALQVQLEL